MAYFFAAAYSWPPIRFKERGTAGLFVSSTAQRFFPLLVGMSVFGRFDLVSWIMGLLFSLMGVRWILVHQIGDIEADRLGGVNSFARTRGAEASLRLVQWVIFPLELICLLAWIGLAAGAARIVLAALPFYVLWLVAATRARGRLPVSWTRFGELPLTHFYMIFWPSALALGAILSAPVVAGLVIVHWLWQRPYLTGEWRKLFSGTRLRVARSPGRGRS
jgi:4-hydroxybenzoate polyprenyltransferase